jgi:beta-phosphoglucomutase-like phosphatase (HAD superfamily)
MAIASGGSRPIIEAAMTGLGLGTLCNVPVTIEDITRGKPARDPFLLAAQRLGVAPDRCVGASTGPGS